MTKSNKQRQGKRRKCPQQICEQNDTVEEVNAEKDSSGDNKKDLVFLEIVEEKSVQ